MYRGVKELFTRKYVGDYRLVNRRDSRGRIRTAAVYCGARFRFASDPGIARKSGYAALGFALASAAAEAPLLLINSALMRTWYVSIFAVIGLLPLASAVFCALRVVSVGRTFRREDRDVFENRFPVSTGFFALLSTAVAAAALIVSLQRPSELLLCVCPAVCAFCGWKLFAMRKRFICAEELQSEDAKERIPDKTL